MKTLRLNLLFAVLLSASLLAGCVSLDNYDEWRTDAYETDGKEQERFEELASEYEHSVLFDSVTDETVMQGVTRTSTVEGGVYRFAHDGTSEYTHFDINPEYLQSQAGGSLERLAVLAKPQNHGNGFVEVYPGGNIDDSGANNPTSSEGNAGLASGRWALVEFIADGDETIVKGHAYERVMKRPLESLSIFCFHGSSIEIDYILFE